MSASTNVTQSAHLSDHDGGLEEEHLSAEQPGRRLPLEIRQQILYAIGSIKYGSVEVVIHDGKVTQIECRERIRMSLKAYGTTGK